MNIIGKSKLLAHILRWRLTWEKHDSDYVPPDLDNPKFMSALDAMRLINDGDVVMSTGMAANARCTIFYFALKELFDATGGPRDLTWIGLGAMGSRGRVPGTLEDCCAPGLITRYVGGHLETVKAQLKLADQGLIELHNLPQGVMGFLCEAQARGEDSIVTDTGAGSFLDPRVGDGSLVLPGKGKSLVAAEGDKLRYTMPRINVALLVTPYADREGNLYVYNAATLTELKSSAYAAKANNGKILAAVGDIVEKDASRIYIPADMVDAIVVNPWNEQTGSVPQRLYWPMFTVGAKVDVDESIEKLRFINTVLKITPVRGEAENALARLAASVFTRIVKKGAMINMGVGLPEEVARLVYEGGLQKDVTFATETGVIGGMPAMGIFFGSAVSPVKMIGSAEMFHRWYEKLDLTLLGMLQADSQGNVNVSKRGEGAINFVGAGGFPDLVRAADKILFIGSWMAHSRMTIREGKLVIDKPGEHKFGTSVDQITFSGKRALELGKQVYYVTNVGVFRLTGRGMELCEVMPGIDVKRDILDGCPMKVVLPDGDVPVTPAEVATGRGFKLEWS